MALKDWKKLGHKDFIEFVNGNAGIKIVDFESGDFKKKGYAVYIKPQNSYSAYRTEFKTKSQAMKLAKDYMREN